MTVKVKLSLATPSQAEAGKVPSTRNCFRRLPVQSGPTGVLRKSLDLMTELTWTWTTFDIEFVSSSYLALNWPFICKYRAVRSWTARNCLHFPYFHTVRKFSLSLSWLQIIAMESCAVCATGTLSEIESNYPQILRKWNAIIAREHQSREAQLR